MTLTAEPSGANDFPTWGGDCSGITLECVLTMSQDRKATARFTTAPD